MNDSLTKYWLGDAADRIGPDSLLKLASHRRAIGNMVRIVTGKAVPVKFNLIDKSFMTNDVVVISALVDNNNYDSNVGLALHEGTHVAISDLSIISSLPMYVSKAQRDRVVSAGVRLDTWFAFVKDMLNVVEDRRIDAYQYSRSPGYRGYYDAMYNRYFYLPEISAGLKDSTYKTEETIDSYEFRVINIIHPDSNLNALKGLREINEILDVSTISRLKNSKDARDCALKICDVISRYLIAAKSTPKPPPMQGKPSDEKEEGQGQSESEQEELPDDLVAVDPSNQPQTGEQDGTEQESNTDDTEKPGEDVEDEDDTDSDKSDETESDKTDKSDESNDTESGKTTEDNDTTDNRPSGDEGKSEGLDEEQSENDNDTTGDSPELSGTPETTPEPLTEEERKEVDDAINKQKEFLNGDVDKEGLTEEQNEEVEIMTEAEVELRDVEIPDKKYKVIVIKRLTKALLNSTLFPFKRISYVTQAAEPTHTDDVAAGIILGKQLGNRLRIINEESYDTTIRKSSGKVVRRLLHELKGGEYNIFSKTEKRQFEKSVVHITIDASGSMQGESFGKALKMAVAVAKAASMTDFIEVVVSLRGNINDKPLVVIAYDSTVDTFKQVETMFPYFEATTWTPEGLCFEAIMNEIHESAKGRNAYFVNLSDGLPEYYGFSGDVGVEYTRQAVEKIRKSGIEVLSYFVNDGENDDTKAALKQFRKMYGKDAVEINIESLTQIAKTLNEKFLSAQPIEAQ